MTKSDGRSEWLDVVAHDLRSPLNAVRQCLELVQDIGPLNEKQQHFMGRAFANIQRMDHLISRLRDITWLDSEMPLDMTEVDLRLLIERAVDLLMEIAAKKALTFDLDIPDTLEPVRGDANRLAQVMDNLLSNAIKYNRDQGSVTIQVRQDQHRVQIDVMDTGIGIRPDDLPRVFERFFRSAEGVRLKVDGTGLGLAIVEGIVQRHGGRIQATSVHGKGSIFSVSLPLRGDTHDGDMERGDETLNLGEGHDDRVQRNLSLASEEADVVPDAHQEKREHTMVDSQSDVD